MRQKYGRHKKRTTRKLQVAWIIFAIVATAIIVVVGSNFLNLKNNKFVEEQDSDRLEQNIETGQNAPSDQKGPNEDNVGVTDKNTPEDTEIIDNGTSGDTENTENIETAENTETDETTENTENTESTESTTTTETTEIIDTTEDTDDTVKVIALTFDDGPNPKVTDRILDVLEKNGARATFFVMGDRMDKYGDTVTKAYSIGCQIGNHTYSHKDLSKLSVKEIKHEVEYSNECIAKYAPIGDAVLRPPYGAKGDKVYETVKVPMITWSVDTEDWKSRDKDAVAKHILETVQDGDIVLMHDLYESTADAIEYVVPRLIDMGYELVTVDELFEKKGITLEAGVVYRNAKGSKSVTNN